MKKWPHSHLFFVIQSMKNWCPTDIDALKIAFLRHVPIKMIARSMGCSPSAINKALTRFDIRPKLLERSWANKRPKHERKLYIVEQKTTTLCVLPQSTSKIDHSKTTPQQLLEFLRGHGQQVEVRVNKSTWNVEFILGYQTLTLNQLLLIANKIRHEQGLNMLVLSFGFS